MFFDAGRRPEVPWSGRILGGGMLLGWALFNLVEGVIDHHLLGVHHVLERAGLSGWDWAFLASGVVLAAAGVLLIRDADQMTPSRRRAAISSADSPSSSP
jgi:uncharacterized membrane protein